MSPVMGLMLIALSIPAGTPACVKTKDRPPTPQTVIGLKPRVLDIANTPMTDTGKRHLTTVLDSLDRLAVLWGYLASPPRKFSDQISLVYRPRAGRALV